VGKIAWSGSRWAKAPIDFAHPETPRTALLPALR
jgi:hypothetical protein